MANDIESTQKKAFLFTQPFSLNFSGFGLANNMYYCSIQEATTKLLNPNVLSYFE